MNMKRIFALALTTLLLCLPVWSMANGSIRPWLLSVGDAKWGPVPSERLETDVLLSNGNIVSKYYQNTGVLYHSYIGNPNNHVISDDTFTRVVIKPPKGAAYRTDFYYEGISLTQSQNEFRYTGWPGDIVRNILEEVNSPKYFDDIRDDRGPVYYDWDRPMFSDRSGSVCTPIQRSSQNKGNVYLVAWYNASKQLIRVDWIVETSDDFSIPKHDIAEYIYEGYTSEANLPSKITRPSLIIPYSRENMQFRLGMYYYPSYRGNTDFAELYLMQEDNDIIVPDYDEGPVVVYWPYPEGYSYSSPVHYQLKHYMDNTRTKFEMLDVTATPKGLRIVTNSFSPFELSWDEVPEVTELPKTGDNSNVILWSALACISLFGMTMLVRKRKEA